MSGKLLRQIFEENGFDINIIGLNSRHIGGNQHIKKDRMIGLQYTRGTTSDNFSSIGLTNEKIIERQDTDKVTKGTSRIFKKIRR